MQDNLEQKDSLNTNSPQTPQLIRTIDGIYKSNSLINQEITSKNKNQEEMYKQIEQDINTYFNESNSNETNIVKKDTIINSNNTEVNNISSSNISFKPNNYRPTYRTYKPQTLFRSVDGISIYSPERSKKLNNFLPSSTNPTKNANKQNTASTNDTNNHDIPKTANSNISTNNDVITQIDSNINRPQTQYSKQYSTRKSELTKYVHFINTLLLIVILIVCILIYLNTK